MLKYIISFCIISLCSSDPRVVGDFNQLVLVLRTPVTALFQPSPNLNTNSQEWLNYLRAHWLVLNPVKWVVQGIWALDSAGERLTECVSADGLPLTYDSENMDEDFAEELKLVWPSLQASETEAALWEREYNSHGSCVWSNEIDYFDEAALFSDVFDIGAMLGIAEIVPGDSYEVSRIIQAIRRIVLKQVYVICLQPEHVEDQYLLEVQVCLNKTRSIVDCYPGGTHQCDRSKTVMYPGMLTIP